LTTTEKLRLRATTYYYSINCEVMIGMEWKSA